VTDSWRELWGGAAAAASCPKRGYPSEKAALSEIGRIEQAWRRRQREARPLIAALCDDCGRWHLQHPPDRLQGCLKKHNFATREAAEAELRLLRREWRKNHKGDATRMHVYECSLGVGPVHWHLGHRPWWTQADKQRANL